MSNDIEFVEGISFKPPRDGAPEYVKARGWIKNAEMIDFLKARIAKGEESTNFDLKESKGGKLYAAVDNWKPEGKAEAPKRTAPKAAATAGGGGGDMYPDEDIPFVTNRSTF